MCPVFAGQTLQSDDTDTQVSEKMQTGKTDPNSQREYRKKNYMLQQHDETGEARSTASSLVVSRYLRYRGKRGSVVAVRSILHGNFPSYAVRVPLN